MNQNTELTISQLRFSETWLAQSLRAVTPVYFEHEKAAFERLTCELAQVRAEIATRRA